MVNTIDSSRGTTIPEVPIGQLGLGRNILAAKGPLDIQNIITRGAQQEGGNLMILEETLTQLRGQTRYIENPQDALALIDHYGEQIGENANPQTVLSLLHIVGEYIAGQERYIYGNGSHEQIHTMRNSQVILTENVFQVLEEPEMYTQSDDNPKIELLQSHQLSTQINAFLLSAPVSEKTKIQKMGGILGHILGVDTSTQTDWGVLIGEANKYLGRQH